MIWRIYRYIFILNILSGGKSCLVAPGVAVPPLATETVLSPWLAVDEDSVSHVLSHVVWWIYIYNWMGFIFDEYIYIYIYIRGTNFIFDETLLERDKGINIYKKTVEFCREVGNKTRKQRVNDQTTIYFCVYSRSIS